MNDEGMSLWSFEPLSRAYGVFRELFSMMPGGQVALLITGFGIWVIGVNILIARHYKRMGKPWWYGFRPFAFPLRSFTWKEWLWLIALAFFALLLMTAGMGW